MQDFNIFSKKLDFKIIFATSKLLTMHNLTNINILKT